MVAVFRTSLQTKQDVIKLAHCFNSLPEFTGWNVDLEDCDNVLRLEGKWIDVDKVQALVRQAGFKCEELPE